MPMMDEIRREKKYSAWFSQMRSCLYLEAHHIYSLYIFLAAVLVDYEAQPLPTGQGLWMLIFLFCSFLRLERSIINFASYS